MSSKGFAGIERYSVTVAEKSNAALDRVTKKSFKTLVKMSPVLTGKFRANWKASIGAANATKREIVQPLLSTGDTITALEIANLIPGLGAKLGQDVFIANNLDYAGFLERGGSRKAPMGVLHISALTIQASSQRSAI